MLLSEVADLMRRAASVEAFAATFGDPVLLGGQDTPALVESGGFATLHDGIPLDGVTPFVRGLTENDTLDELEAGTLGIHETPGESRREVVRLRKSARNPFLHMITIGRAANNDVHLNDATISKLHAIVKCHEGAWFIHDQCSTNGTYVDGDGVPPEGVALRGGSLIRFGTRLAFQFHSASSLSRLIEGLGARVHAGP